MYSRFKENILFFTLMFLILELKLYLFFGGVKCPHTRGATMVSGPHKFLNSIQTRAPLSIIAEGRFFFASGPRSDHGP